MSRRACATMGAVNEKRKVLIVFPDDWLAYSPTVTNLRDHLAQDFEVSIIAFDSAFCAQKLQRPNVCYIQLPARMLRWLQMLQRWLPRVSGRLHVSAWAKAFYFCRRLREFQPDEVIAVDPLAMWCAQKSFRRSKVRLHMVSLELHQRDPFVKLLDASRIDSVLTQTPERYEHLFPRQALRVFYVQNAPVCPPPSTLPTENRTGLVHCGTATPRFGICRSLDFLREYPDFHLTVQGLMNDESKRALADYADLIDTGRLNLNTEYLETAELLKFLRRFRIGFCFYDFRHLPRNSFNYLNVPSGKMFNYYAAGVPVIGVEIPGLKSVQEFEAGILLTDLSPSAIRGAIERVESDHARYSANCLAAAEHFSFDRAVRPFQEHLLNRQPRPAAGSISRP